jgi:aryl-alcohol dehydrogenase-like predicted oxidoreductase
METRRFGRTEHMSTVAIFGTYALSQATQDEADKVMDRIMEAGVNHIDVAPSYGNAEECLGPWLARERSRFFLGCKTMERTKADTAESLHRSLERLKVDYFDLFQMHAVNSIEGLDQVTMTGGALDAIVEAREAGLVRYIGITGHIPSTYIEALERFDFDSVLFPYNFVQAADPEYRQVVGELLNKCRAKDVGVMVIKSIAKSPWGEKPQTKNTWYEPFIDPENIQQAVNFVLSHDITGICTVGDSTLMPLVLKACENYKKLSETEQETLMGSGEEHEPLFPSRLPPKTKK